MDSTNQTIIKAVFLFPLTKALKYQHERLSNEKDKYDVIDVDNPIEAGQVLSMEKCGILFCSDSKKAVKCLEKYEKLFSDSRYRIILVLPKRIIGKEAAELSNRGVQDILVEPITEKALTTKVSFNFQMILKLLDAALKQAKRLEDLAKAKEDAIALKKSQDEKRKLKQEERIKQATSNKFWSDKEKAQEALKFKPVEGKMNGTDNVNFMENSAATLNALNLYNNSIEAFHKTMHEKAEEIENAELTIKKKSDFQEKDHIDGHINGKKSSNDEDELQSIEFKKNGLNLMPEDEKTKNNESGKNNSEDDKLASFETQKKGLLLPEQILEININQEKNPSSGLLAHRLKNSSPENAEENSQSQSFSGAKIADTEINKNEKSNLTNSVAEETTKFEKSSVAKSPPEETNLKSATFGSTEEELKLNDKSAIPNASVDNIAALNKSTTNAATSEELKKQEAGKTITPAEELALNQHSE